MLYLTTIDLQYLCLELAPELRQNAFYVAWREHYHEFAMCENFLAATSPGLDVALFPGQPRGPAILLNATTIRRWAESFDEAAMTFNRCLAEACLHELAHILDRPSPPYFEPDASKCPGRAGLALGFLGLQFATVPWIAAKLQAVDRDSHSSQWVRIACHLRYRARAYGLSLANILHSERYGLPSAADCLHALGSEPARMADWPFEKIKATSPPVAFAALFAGGKVPSAVR